MRKTLALVLLALLVLACGCGEGDGAQQAPPAQSEGLKCVFEDPEFSFQLLRTMGESAYACADIGECLTTAYRIQEGDFESWYREWYATAERLEAVAEGCLAEGRRVSAREAYLRAMNYYRTAEFFLHGDTEDPRILETWGRSRDCFVRAAALFSPEVESVEIPYEDTALPGYFYRVDESGVSRPLLIVHSGYDGTKEELFCQAAAALQRGYNCLTFEGPGQGEVIREQGIPFRPDWEKVITPAVDYALTRGDVDPARIALMGISLGGYLAPRGASGENRLAALIANGGVYFPLGGLISNVSEEGGLPSDPAEFLEYVREYPDDFDREMQEAAEGSPTLRWFLDNGMFVFDADSPSEFVLLYSEMTMEGRAGSITCPTLVIDSEDDDSFPGQPEELYDSLSCTKDFMLFRAEEGAGEHCQMGAMFLSNQRIFDWLDQVLTPGV